MTTYDGTEAGNIFAIARHRIDPNKEAEATAGAALLRELRAVAADAGLYAAEDSKRGVHVLWIACYSGGPGTYAFVSTDGRLVIGDPGASEPITGIVYNPATDAFVRASANRDRSDRTIMIAGIGDVIA